MSTSVRRGMDRPSRSSRIVPPHRFSTVKNVPELWLDRYRSTIPPSPISIFRAIPRSAVKESCEAKSLIGQIDLNKCYERIERIP